MWNVFSQVLAEVRVLDIIDVAIVYYVFYRLIVLIRDTRAVQLIKGLAVLLGVTVISDRLGLWTLNWLLSRTIAAGFVAVPILFWPELRRALEHLGRSSILSKRFHLASELPGRSRLAVLVADAAGALSQTRTGALIVVERETGLTEYTETGVTIDAVVSIALLTNTFVPNTPLHDGAVVIRHGRIAAAGCYLPLSANHNLDQELGTRHRAALGITEETDALAVVVSEETGSISLAEGGKLFRHLDARSLAKRLEESLHPDQVPSLFPWGVKM
ncbi:MAG: Cyclic di-AMP synthase CdaA [Firmicutes bacterium]|nr:Cyclic di-AMP synthase CdaA [candidate division NPL-UPA2 bacterium]MBT9153569.1 Cyclic di-AMP synthase CdaA [candidate division NPL-UPA2 bacterium]MBT9155624.1 Cyclic di-AMP synthase CdaA [candidate division NPL-UPA2 bacterium]